MIHIIQYTYSGKYFAIDDVNFCHSSSCNTINEALADISKFNTGFDSNGSYALSVVLDICKYYKLLVSLTTPDDIQNYPELFV